MTTPTPNQPEPTPSADDLERMLIAKLPDFNPSWEPDTQRKWFALFEQFMNAVFQSKTRLKPN